MQVIQHRVLLAGALAPIIGVLALSLAGAIWTYDGTTPVLQILDNAGFGAVLISVFGLLPAYLIEWVGIATLLPWLQRTNRLRLAWVIVPAAILGAVAFVPWMLVLGMRRSLTDIGATVLIGMVAGAVAGATFWVVAFSARRSDAPA
jgi:hypothetical protein